MRAKIAGLVLLTVSGCSSDDDDRRGTGQGEAGATQGATGAGASAGVGAKSGAASDGDGGTNDGGTNDGGANDGGAASAVPRLELPEGSREVDGIVNLVDAEAAQELDEFLGQGVVGLTSSVNLFLTYYEEQYDFVFVFTDHDLPAGSLSGRFLHVTSQPRVGTGIVSQYAAEGYRTSGRLRGAIGVKYGAGPFSHEIMHNWGVFLDRSFSFGVGKMYNSPVHWGYAGVHGVLGGFDAATLSCQSPAGAAPTDCDATANGRYRYVVGSFNTGSNDVPFAPLELYLIGLASVEDVPEELPLLLDAQEVPNSFDAQTGTEVVEAAGLSVVTMSDITALHGVATELPEDERRFSSAFVVVSASPASDEVMAEVAQRAAAFGGRGTHPLTKSFASDTGDRATMETKLGPRRAVSDTAPEPRPPFQCDALANDCDGGLACYVAYCGIPGDVPVNGSCNVATDCVAGTDCLFLDPPAGQCAQFCDQEDVDSPLACASLCPSSTLTIVDADGKPLATYCRPE